MKRAAQLSISERTEGQERILSLKGSADILSISAVQDCLARASREEIRLLLVDLSEGSFEMMGLQKELLNFVDMEAARKALLQNP
jgi:hypothetical protein